MSVYKVLYQANKDQIPTRENTQAMYFRADSIPTIREELAKNETYQQFNIEYIAELTEAHLAYEQETVEGFHIKEV